MQNVQQTTHTKKKKLLWLMYMHRPNKWISFLSHACVSYDERCINFSLLLVCMKRYKMIYILFCSVYVDFIIFPFQFQILTYYLLHNINVAHSLKFLCTVYCGSKRILNILFDDALLLFIILLLYFSIWCCFYLIIFLGETSSFIFQHLWWCLL